jgi:hypothetical protein
MITTTVKRGAGALSVPGVSPGGLLRAGSVWPTLREPAH